MSASKQTILDAIRRNRPAESPLPELRGAWTTYEDRRAQFIEVLQSVGGQARVVKDRDDLNRALKEMTVYAEARRIASLVSDVGQANVDWSSIDSPHALDDVDVAILPGEFAVAENGAVWITDRNVPLRAIYYICQHLVLVVRASEIVDHMHAAYERLATAGPDGGSTFAEPRFGAFISGPSKTADIEQSLVIGAHGPRSLTVFLIEAT